MLRATKVFVRANTNTSWFEPTQTFKDYNKQTYTDTGLRLSTDRNVSVDGLTKTVITEWKDQAAYDQFLNDSVCKEMFALRQTYNQANGITTTPASTESI